MNDPWNIRKHEEREADTITTFIIFCEDKVSEPVYFKYFETPLIKVNPVPNQKNNFKNVLKAINRCKSDGLMIYNGDGVLEKKENQGIHVWCVFDRDKEPVMDNKAIGDDAFNESIHLAESKGIKVAWSNDAFELWILLHYQDIDPENLDYQNRATYYQILTEILRNRPSPNEFLKKALAHSSFSYEKDMKSDKNFRNIVRNDIVKNTKLAIARAKALEAYHAKAINRIMKRLPVQWSIIWWRHCLPMGNERLCKFSKLNHTSNKARQTIRSKPVTFVRYTTILRICCSEQYRQKIKAEL